MEIPNRTNLIAFILSLAAMAAVHAQAIKTFPLDDQTVYHLKVATTKITTIAFPQAITGLESTGLSADLKVPAKMLLSYHPGEKFFSVRALSDSATAALNVICNRKVYVLELAADKEPFQSVRFYLSEVPTAAPLEKGNTGPNLLLGLLDQAKAYPLLAQQYPEMVSQIDTAQPFTRTLYRGFDVILTRVFRFDAEDALIFEVEFVNHTDQPIYYVPQSLAVRVGPGVYWSALSDATGIMGPGTADPKSGQLSPGHSVAYFVICGSAEGGRNHLSVQNPFNILVFRQENS